ncbi:hypothetical protein [Streptomyces flaveus]|uniref:Uncharacterized protein n=1 Tax=Streptomyces flaveus TaxID=66370 RepID=A0A917VJ06_9ACTN|nr:hypothetical protein [Streptomyces flaveus]GGK84693.1 hypothetical protein GCM10010094_52340 [Streptomyces flaveus]
MIRLRWGIVVSGWIALAATALPESSAARVVIVAAFLLVCPGLAAVLLCTGRVLAPEAGRVGILEAAVVTGAISLAISVLVAEALFLGHAFTPVRALLVLAGLTSVAALASTLPRPRGIKRFTPVPSSRPRLGHDDSDRD